MFIISLIGLVVLVGIAYAIFPIPEVLWFGGAVVVFWISDRIRREIEDNVYINAAFVSIMSILAMIPQIFLHGNMIIGSSHYLLCSLFLSLQTMTHQDHLSTYIRKRDFAPIMRNDNYSDAKKSYLTEVMANGNRAAIILILIGFNVAMALLGALIYMKSIWFILLPPAFVILANMIAIFYMQIVGVQPPHGYSHHESVTNLLLGYGYLAKKFFGGILAVILAPFRFIAFIAKKIAGFFMDIRDGGTIRVGIAFWILFGLIGVYDLIGFFGLIDELEGAIESLGVYEFRIVGFRITKFMIEWMGSWDVGFLLDVLLFLVKVVLVVVPAVLDILLLILSLIGWLLFMLLITLSSITIVSILPALLLGGAITFLVFYLLDSNRDGYDIFKFVFFVVSALALTVVYYLFLGGVIKVF